MQNTENHTVDDEKFCSAVFRALILLAGAKACYKSEMCSVCCSVISLRVLFVKKRSWCPIQEGYRSWNCCCAA